MHQFKNGLTFAMTPLNSASFPLFYLEPILHHGGGDLVASRRVKPGYHLFQVAADLRVGGFTKILGSS